MLIYRAEGVWGVEKSPHTHLKSGGCCRVSQVNKHPSHSFGEWRGVVEVCGVE